MATIQDMIEKLQRFGDEINDLSGKKITILPDSNGMIDRQCPNCKEFFMIHEDDFERLSHETCCPSCGHKGNGSDFTSDVHHKAVKEFIESALLENWHNNSTIPNNVISLQSDLALSSQMECPHCNSVFASSVPGIYCPSCGIKL